MRVAYFSVEGSTLSWSRRLFDEGVDVLVYVSKPHARKIGAGIVPRSYSVERWIEWGNKDRNTIWFFDCTNAGELADRLRRAGKLVIGGSAFMDRLECDRPYGESFARRHGLTLPPTKSFASVRESIAYMRETKKQEVGDGGWAWKPNKDLGASTTFVGDTEKVAAFCERMLIPKHGDRVSCIVQERVGGVALSTARWWNGTAWTGPYEGTLEEKKFMNGDLGPATGCSLNTLWFYLEEQPKIAQALKWEALAIGMAAESAPPGLYDINAMVNERDAYFLEWTPRLGIDSELTSQRAIKSLAELFMRLAHGQEIDDLFNTSRGYHAVRLSVPPYPTEDKELARAGALGTPVDGIDSLWRGNFVMAGLQRTTAGFEVADPYGFIGSCVVAHTSVEGGFARIAEACEKFQIPDLQYRTDAAKIVAADIAAMKKSGWGTTPYLSIGERKAVA